LTQYDRHLHQLSCTVSHNQYLVDEKSTQHHKGINDANSHIHEQKSPANEKETRDSGAYIEDPLLSNLSSPILTFDIQHDNDKEG